MSELSWKMYEQMYVHGAPSQEKLEYFFYLLLVKQYFDMMGVTTPLVVEIGVRGVKQAAYYSKFIGGSYLGIDIQDKGRDYVMQGDSRDKATLDKLVHRLGGRKIDLLFIDGDHAYDTVKSDWDMYSPLVKHIVAFHDICWGMDWMPDKQGEKPSVRQFWQELYGLGHQMISLELPDLMEIEEDDGSITKAQGGSGIGLVFMNRKFDALRVKYKGSRFSKLWGKDGRAYPRFKPMEG